MKITLKKTQKKPTTFGQFKKADDWFLDESGDLLRYIIGSRIENDAVCLGHKSSVFTSAGADWTHMIGQPVRIVEIIVEPL